MKSRQVIRAEERRKEKMHAPRYPLSAQIPGKFVRIRRNRRYRGDGKDYFDETSAVRIAAE